MTEHAPEANIIATAPLKKPKRKLSTSLMIIGTSLGCVCVWLLAYPIIKSSGQIGIIYDFYALLILYPLLVGIAAARIISTKDRHLIALTMWTGLIAFIGVSSFFYILANRDDIAANASCLKAAECHVGGIETFVLFLLICFELALILVAAVLTGVIIWILRRIRSKIKKEQS
jgi:hypothetical protein